MTHTERIGETLVKLDRLADVSKWDIIATAAATIRHLQRALLFGMSYDALQCPPGCGCPDACYGGFKHRVYAQSSVCRECWAEHYLSETEEAETDGKAG